MIKQEVMGEENKRIHNGLTAERAAYFAGLGLYDEAAFIVNALIDQAVERLSADDVVEAERIIDMILPLDIRLPHIHYIKALCLIERDVLLEAKSHLTEELSIAPDNNEVRSVLDQVEQELLKG